MSDKAKHDQVVDSKAPADTTTAENPATEETSETRPQSKPKFGPTAWKDKRANESAIRQEQAAQRNAQQPKPLNESERAAVELSRRAQPLPEFNVPSALVEELSFESLPAIARADEIPRWCRDGSRPGAENYGYVWYPADEADAKLTETFRSALLGNARDDQIVAQARDTQMAEVRGWGLDVPIWTVCNTMTLSFLRPSDTGMATGCVSRRIGGQLDLLLACRREVYEMIYGVSHTKEERRAGAVDKQGLSARSSSAMLGNVTGPRDGMVDVKDRMGVSATARADRAFMVLDETSMNEPGGIIEDRPDGRRQITKDGLYGTVSHSVRDIPGVVVADE